MFIVPHPDPTTQRQRAENGLALLEFNHWTIDEIRANVIEDLATFDMNDMCNCVIGRTVGWSNRGDLIGFSQEGFTSYGSDFLFGFDSHDIGTLQDAWIYLLDLEHYGDLNA